MIKLDELYNEVNKYIKEIDFNKLWPDFKPLKFALYNQNECFFDGNYIEKTDLFLGNTSIKYKDEYIAIWHVMEEISPEILTSKMIHEMFHGFQNIHHESRFPDEIKAIYEYRYLNENLSLKLDENKILVELIDIFSMDKFNTLLSLRKYRYAQYQKEFIYESKIEQIEGTANFIELKVLEQINNALYHSKLESLKKAVINPNRFLPIRIISYDIGALFIKILVDNHIVFNQGFNEVTINENMIKNIEPLKYKPNNDLKNFIQDYFDNGDKLINLTINTSQIVMDGYEDLIGFNVYNAFYHQGFIISRYFVMYGSKDNPSILYGDFVIESKEVGKVSRIYRIPS